MSDDHPCKYEADIAIIKTQCSLIPEMHQAIVGKANGTPGMREELRDLKAWRKSMSSRIKSRVAWIWGLIGSVIGGGVLLFVAKRVL